ncbi:MAG: (Fe-S)-binding protein [Bacteroidota bacterium]
MVSQVVFTLLVLVSFGIAARKYAQLRRNILLGKAEKISGDSDQRLKNVVLIAFGQQKMFKRWLPAVLHFFIYAAFVITQIELIEILVDGFTGRHRFFYKPLGGFYVFIISFIEILSVLAFIATFAFLARRNLLKIPRFHMPEMNGWPKLDGNIILYLEALLIIFIFMMNGADETIHVREGKGSYGFAVSSLLAPMFESFSTPTLHTLERIGWWGHIIIVFGFLNYLPFSKHLHVILAFPNVYYSKLTPKGEMENMPDIMNEVKSMMGLTEGGDEMPPENMDELPQFGASDVFTLSWKNLLDAYSCTECGRCSSVCPANITGKKLSPRKIMMDVRDRAEEIGNNLDLNNLECLKPEAKGQTDKLTKDNYDDGRSLFDLISNEELHACTTCNACVEACPVTINPLDIILKLRRHEILDLAAGPQDWLPMFTSIENSGSVWQISDDRDAWTSAFEEEVADN